MTLSSAARVVTITFHYRKWKTNKFYDFERDTVFDLQWVLSVHEKIRCPFLRLKSRYNENMPIIWNFFICWMQFAWIWTGIFSIAIVKAQPFTVLNIWLENRTFYKSEFQTLLPNGCLIIDVILQNFLVSNYYSVHCLHFAAYCVASRSDFQKSNRNLSRRHTNWHHKGLWVVDYAHNNLFRNSFWPKITKN